MDVIVNWVFIPQKKKALRVLDEIQEHLELYTDAFQMPADEDIEMLEDMYNDDSNEGEDF